MNIEAIITACQGSSFAAVYFVASALINMSDVIAINFDYGNPALMS